jgi:ArsR family transcriptional regulator
MESIRTLAEPLRLLGDEVRLRILRLLRRERLNGTELTAILGIAQSAVSKHLGALRDAGLVREDRRGGWAYFDLERRPPGSLGPLWRAVQAAIERPADEYGDDARLAEVLQDREERGEGPAAGLQEPGRSWSAWARALGHLLPPLRVVHLGCGRGALSREVARWAGAVVGVDPDARSTAAAAAEARRQGVANLTFRTASATATGLPAASFDLALVAQALHLVEEPEAVLREAARLVVPGGRALVMDLMPHREAWVRDRLGHRRLGCSPDEVTAWLEAAGFRRVRVEETDRRRGNPFRVLIASATREKR